MYTLQELSHQEEALTEAIKAINKDIASIVESVPLTKLHQCQRLLKLRATRDTLIELKRDIAHQIEED